MQNNNQSIVILDDDIETINIFKKYFASFKNYNIKYFTVASTDFLNYINDNEVDLFIIDMCLNYEKNEIQISDDIIENHNGSLFLFISDGNYDKHRLKSLDGKCIYHFINKPLKMEILWIIISTLLNIARTLKLVECCKIAIGEIDSLREQYRVSIQNDRKMIDNYRTLMLE